jgi:protease-4
MDDIVTPPDEPSQPAPTPAPSNGHEHMASARRVKRRLMYGLIGLYAASVLAGSVLLLRNQSPESKKKAEPGGKGGLMSALADKETVGWIPIHGVITMSEGGKPWEKGVEQWSRKLKAMAEQKGVKAIVLDINSPGGSVGAVQELYSQILRVRKEKQIPVIALFDDVSASGGYYIASACDRIVAHPGTITGSIGVIFQVSNLEGLFSKVGYKVDPIKSGKHKDIGSPARPMTAEERQLLQAMIDDAYGQFVEAVSTGRNIPVDQVKKLADGRIFSGRQALESKLVDQLGDSTDAIALAGQLGHIDGKPHIRRDTEKFSDIFDMLESRLGGGLVPTAAAELLGKLEPMGPGLHYRLQGF